MSEAADHVGVPVGEPWPWDQRYADHPWPSDPDPLLVEAVAHLAAGRALDLGCGPGRNSLYLARLGWQVTGVDASAVGLSLAAARADSEGLHLELVRDDLLTYRPEAGGFDLVVVANIHMRSGAQEQLFATATQALSPGGHLFIVGHHLDDLGRHGPPDADLLYTEEKLRDGLPSELRVDRLERVVRALGDGEEGEPDVAVVLLGHREAARA